ncbi:MAG: ABC transporter permease [Pirellulaceae bacterium]|nr:ABC transporter permease [Pirellulaceae bacterium]
MNFWRLVLNNFYYYRRLYFGVVLAVMVTTAVLTGALLVGDSVRGSLRELALDGLGEVDTLFLGSHFFREEVADEVTTREENSHLVAEVEPVILLPRVTVMVADKDLLNQESSASKEKRSERGVTLFGVGSSFWKSAQNQLEKKGFFPEGGLLEKTENLEQERIVLNRPLAEKLGVTVGQKVSVHISFSSSVAGDSLLGAKEIDTYVMQGLTVSAILPAKDIGRFSLSPTQQEPVNGYVSLTSLQEAIDREDKINTLFVTFKDGADLTEVPKLRLNLADLGMKLTEHRLDFEDSRQEVEKSVPSAQTIYHYQQLSTESMVFPESVEDALNIAATDENQPIASPFSVATYLVNKIEKITTDRDSKQEQGAEKRGITGDENRGRSIPYSTVTGIDFTRSHFHQLRDSTGELISDLANDEVVLNSWAANELGAVVGDRVHFSYFLPETTYGQAVEDKIELRVKAIVALTEPRRPIRRLRPALFEARPTTANDPHFTPVVKGITDQATISTWNPPFPFDQSAILPSDETYWDNHRTTPKAFVSLDLAQKLWGSRFGRTTTFRFTVRERNSEESRFDGKEQAEGDINRDYLVQRLETTFEPFYDDLGFSWHPIRASRLLAARGTTDFNFLFIGFSSFLVVASLFLTSLLFQLGLEERQKEIGILKTFGWQRGKMVSLYLVEGLGISSLGAALGLLLGIGYGWLMLTGLTTLWVEAISTPFLTLHVTATSLFLGFGVSLFISVGTIYFSVRKGERANIGPLLWGKGFESLILKKRGRGTNTTVLWSGILGIVGCSCSIAALNFRGELQAGLFFGGGATFLALFLYLFSVWLKWGGRRLRPVDSFVLTIRRLAFYNVQRNPTRSLLSVGLIASAAFLIIAIGAFRLKPSAEGTGGFTLIGESDQLIFENLNDRDTREKLFGGERAKQFADTECFSFRVKGATDSSCRNLYKTKSTRVLGVTETFIDSFDNELVENFAFAASSAMTEEELANHWRTLHQESAEEGIPVILDKNTAMFSLSLFQGIGETFTREYEGKEVTFRVVGLLSNTVLQGSLLISERDFQREFPEISGYRYFLLSTEKGQEALVQHEFEEYFSDYGFQTSSTETVLRELMAVQNTYLSTFQSLGGLGLLLGTLGLAVVQMRNLHERKSEFGLLRAVGLFSGQLQKLLFWETIFLLFGGLVIGLGCAMVTAVPHMIFGDAHFPTFGLFVMFAAIGFCGLAASYFGLKKVTRVPLLDALRNE